MTKQDAIDKLQSLQRNDEGSNVHASADTVLCDFLDASGYGEIAREFLKIHKMHPVMTPKYSKPSWRLRPKIANLWQWRKCAFGPIDQKCCI